MPGRVLWHGRTPCSLCAVDPPRGRAASSLQAWDEMRKRCLGVLILAIMLSACGSTAFGEDVAPDPAEDVLTALRRMLAWYQQARLAMQSANDAAGSLVVREDEQTVLRVLQRAFDVARARAALLAQSGARGPSAATPASARAARRASLEVAVREGEGDLARLRERARNAPSRRRAALEREIVAASRRLDLARLRLEFVTSLEEADSSLASGDLDLIHQVQALQEAVPELNAANSPQKTVVTTSPAPGPGTWAVVHRLLALQRSRGALEQITLKTKHLAHDVDAQLTTTRDTVRPLAERLRALASNSGDAGAAPPAESGQDFQAQLQRMKALAAVMVPLRGESALLHRLVVDIQGWQRTLERERRHVFEELALDLVGVVVALVIIFIGALLWRVATMRYITDPYRRRLSITTRNVVAALAVVLVLVFRFTPELTALVTALGFAAAGIAFALQNVILAVAGYFSMVAPNGIRVGDRVSLQGPFGYVHGEVLEIGFVRIRLRELSGDSLQPTGRTVVFPNSVVFTGSFYKLPPPPHMKAA